MREGARETILNNRKRLCTITEIIVWCGRQPIALCGRQPIALCGHCESGTDMEGVQIASTDQATFVLCSTFVSWLETLSWGTTFRVQLEVPHTHPPISRISWSAYVVTTIVMQSKASQQSLLYFDLQMRSLIAPTRNNSALSWGMLGRKLLLSERISLHF